MKLFLCIALAAAAVHAQSAAPTVTFPATGARSSTANSNLDANWTIVKNTLSGESGSGAAAIVGNLPNGWVKPDPGTAWISVQPDQTNATRPGTCCVGESQYQVTFNVDDPAKAVLQFKVAGDEDMDIYLNGFDTNRVIYSSTGPTYSRPETITRTQGQLYQDPGGDSHVVQFRAGLNTLLVVVGNLGGGPTGIYLSPTSPPSSLITLGNTAPPQFAAVSLTDPVDSASGQFFDTLVDFRLGGPMQLGLERFYSSQLAASGVASALGTNWMTNYDISAQVSATKSQILLFGGRVVTFTNSGGQWRLASPLTRAWQFAIVNGGGSQFGDPVEGRIYSFSSAGQLTKIEDRSGNAITVTPGANGPSKVTDGLGRTLTFTYSGTQLTSVQDQSGRSVAFSYAAGLLSTVTDTAKAVTNYSYSSVGSKTALMTKETLPLGNAPTVQTYDASGRVVTQTGPSGNASKLAYSGSGGTTITDPAGSVALQQSDTDGNLIQSIDPSGNTGFRTYDANKRLATVTNLAGATLQYGYDNQSSNVTAVTDPYGNTASYSFLTQSAGAFTFYDLSSFQYPGSSGTVNMTYDPKGRLLSLTMPDQTTANYAYDAAGRITQFTNPLGNATRYTWNPNGTIASVKDALGNTTRFEYDALNRISQATDPNGRVEQYAYDAAGRETTYNLPGQAPWTRHFNTNGQLDSTTTPVGGLFSFTYNSAGLLETETDPLKNVTTFSYDTLNRVSKVQMPGGESVSYTRDRSGNILASTDSSGFQTQYTTDALGRVVSQKDATNRTTTYSYTKTGELASTSSSSGNTLKFGYDVQGNPTTRVDAAGNSYIASFDSVGRFNGVTGPGGFRTSVTRDAMGRPTSLTSANGNTWTASYDALGRPLNGIDPLGNTTSYVYQGVRLSEIDFPLGSVQYTYDALGRVANERYSDGTSIDSTYNSLGQILTSNHLAIERDTAGQMTKVNGIGITRDAAGRLSTLTYADGKTVTYTYNKAGFVESISDWTGAKTAFSYDQAGRRSAQTLPNGVTTTYDYDADGALAGITYGTLGSIRLTLDAAGRIASADRNLPSAPALQDSADQYSFNAAGQLTDATYDTMGRVTAQGGRTFTWDLSSELTGFSDPVNSGAFSYDGALGEMWSSTASGASQTYVFNYAMYHPALSIVQQGGADRRYFVYLPDGELLYSIDANDGSLSFYHFDEMGNTAFLTDASGAVTDSYAITPYGEVADHAGTSDNPFTWQGQYGAIQEARGLFYLRSRHYDAIHARFLSPDPESDAEPQASEPYAYGRGNPMLYTDPFGTAAGCSGFFGCVGSFFQNLFHPAPVSKVKPVVTKPKAAPVLRPPARVPAPPIVLLPPALSTPLISQDGNSLLQRAVANGVITQAGAALILKLEGIISDNSEGLRALNQLISQDGNGLISQDGNGLRQLVQLIGQDGNGLTHWAQLISQDGNSLTAITRLIGQDGNGLLGYTPTGLLAGGASGLFSNTGTSFGGFSGASLVPRKYGLSSVLPPPPPKPKNNKN